MSETKRRISKAKAVLGGLAIWFGWGLLIIVFEFPVAKPKSIAAWIFWSAVAPLIYIVVGLIVASPFMLVSKAPPVAWVAKWIRCEDGQGDPLIRFGALAIGFLVLFFIGLRVFFDYP
jgi:hypothetical protein